MQRRGFGVWTTTSHMRVFRKFFLHGAAELLLIKTAHRDIVDTEHSSGDLNKMLLGSFVEEFDKKDEMLSTPPLTPSRGNSYGISRPLPPPHLPLFPDLVQRTSPHAMPPRVDTVQPSTRTSHVTYGSDGTGRTPERVQTIPSIQYHGR